jgi:hypothetical protein
VSWDRNGTEKEEGNGGDRVRGRQRRRDEVVVAVEEEVERCCNQREDGNETAAAAAEKGWVLADSAKEGEVSIPFRDAALLLLETGADPLLLRQASSSPSRSARFELHTEASERRDFPHSFLLPTVQPLSDPPLSDSSASGQAA